MRPSRRILVGLACLACGALWLPVPAGAAANEQLEFDVDGVLPSSEPDVSYVGSPTEMDVYTVASGLLEQRTFTAGAGAAYTSGAAADPALPLTIELRLRVLQTNSCCPVAFAAYDGSHSYEIGFGSSFSGAFLNTASGVTQVAGFSSSVFHTYRLESPANSDVLDLYVDDALMATVSAPTTTSVGYLFGDSPFDVTDGGDADWDFVRISQATQAPVLAPPGLAVLAAALGLASASRLRRRIHPRG